MAIIPSIISGDPLTRNQGSVEDYLLRYGWKRTHRGKVRDTYQHFSWPDRILVVATDRLSIFDHILPVTVPRKGEVLTGLTHFFLTEVLSDVDHGMLDRKELPRVHDYFPLERCIMMRKVKVQPYELIFRAHIGGSVWKKYLDTGIVAGQQLPSGLTKWQKLESPIFTPSTKAEHGHDVNITADEYFEAMGDLGHQTVDVLGNAYGRAYDFAASKGILILDTKFEAGDPFLLIDEVLTPDSSRFTTDEDYERAMAEKRDPVFWDKEPARDWGRTVETPFYEDGGPGVGQPIVGINNLDPDNGQHRVFIHNALVPKIPRSIVDEASARYLQIFEMIVGMSLDEYQKTKMAVAA